MESNLLLPKQLSSCVCLNLDEIRQVLKNQFNFVKMLEPLCLQPKPFQILINDRGKN